MNGEREGEGKEKRKNKRKKKISNPKQLLFLKVCAFKKTFTEE